MLVLVLITMFKLVQVRVEYILFYVKNKKKVVCHIRGKL